MIEVKNITKSFDGRVVLKDISTTFEDGKTNLIIGRSGSGKTVMIKNIIGLMKPDTDRKSTRLNSSHRSLSRMPSSA